MLNDCRYLSANASTLLSAGRGWLNLQCFIGVQMGDSVNKFSVQPDHLLIQRPEGYEVVFSELPAMLAEMSAACEVAGCRKVLILGPRTKVSLSTTDIFDLGERIAEVGLQIAVVEQHDATRINSGFLENVAFNRGGHMRFFDDEQDAKDWLGVK
jgi:hypothetical protein